MLTLALYGISDPLGDDSGELHDHSVAIMESGKVVEFIELERVSRKKHDNRLGFYIDEIIQGSRIKLPNKFNLVFVDSYAGRMFVSKNHLIHLEAKTSKNNHLASIPEIAEGKFGNYDVNVYVCNHELAHIGSHLVFTGSFKDDSLLIHIDGGASNSNCSAWLFRNGKLSHLHHSWELHTYTNNYNENPLCSAILGIPFGNSLELAGKLMGYAGLGRSNPEIKSWLQSHNWFLGCDPSLTDFFQAASKDFGWDAKNFNPKDSFLMDIAASIQEALSENVTNYIFRFQKQTGAKHLYYSGGVALNIDCNSHIENSGLFDSIHIPPCCNDTGLALGAGAIFEFLTYGHIERHSPFLNSHGLNTYRYAPRFSIKDIANRIAQGDIFGLCVGYGEVGPRALGHRSILANPSSLAIRDRVSIDMKKREWYRPVAPVVLREISDQLFVGASKSPLSRYMLGSYLVRQEMREKIPGVVHVDGTARAQVVDEDDPEFRLLAEILKELKISHNIPCLINTSFNRRGEPIVHTNIEAMQAGREMGLSAIIIENEFVDLAGS